MKLNKKEMLLVSFVLFSLFFGAGNLIFPSFLGQSAGDNTFISMLGFLITAVLLPVLGVIVVAKFGGLDKLGRNVGKHFSLVFALLIYLAIGPGLGIPRAASVPFEMAVAPYLPSGANTKLCMLIYSLIFFLIALWLCLTPNKLVERIGHYLTPSLLFLLVFLFISFLFKGDKQVGEASGLYLTSPFLKGFSEGYNTMDAIAALNFGLVIATTLKSFGLNDEKDQVKYTVKAGVYAGIILALIYMMLSYMGMCSSAVYSVGENGAITLRNIVYQLYGNFGAIILAAIFTLACLTTCVGLINSISAFFADKFKVLNYTKWVYVIVIFSFIVCNQGLNTILSISIPILNAIYPISIVLILLGLSHNLWLNNKIVYPLVISGTAIVSIIYSLEQVGLKVNFISNLANKLPLYDQGYGWVCVTLVLLCVSVLLNLLKSKNNLFS